MTMPPFRKYWKTSLLLGSASLVGLVAFSALPITSALGASPQSTPTVQPSGSSATQPILGQGRGMGQSQGMGQGRGHGQGHPAQGRGPRGQHLAEAASQLGVSEEALRNALGLPDQLPARPDLATAAAQLGTTETELRDALRNHMQTQHQARQGQGPHNGPPDFTAVAQQFGVSEAEFRRIMGIPDRPDLAAAAAQLGVSEDALRDALRSAHGNRGPCGDPDQGRGPRDNRGPGMNPGNSGGGR